MLDTLLLEIGTEEIPARFLPKINEQLAKLAQDKLAALNIAHQQIKVYSTPRRMALIINELAQMQPDSKQEAKGPALKIALTEAGEYSKAALGFARSQGVEPQELIQKDGYIYACKTIIGQKVQDLLPQILTDIITSLHFPKNMRWADYELRFVRPIHWLVALLGDKVIDLEITDIKSSNFTYGHRFLSSGKIIIDNAANYQETLRKASVIVDQQEREQLIRAQIKELAETNKAVAKIDEELLEEVIYLVEYPTALCGYFAEEFLSLPKEAIITPMKEHQRYFPLFSNEGQLLPMFITVRNGNAHNLAVVSHGNERVLKARLSDAAFFFNEDRKIKLQDRLEKLKTVVFQDGLGSMYDKVQRIKTLSSAFAKLAGYTEIAALERTATLAKADLVTGMVCEFTELQGVMGREYAKLEGEAPEVYDGIFEHYLPRFADDMLPTLPTGIFVGLADKLDNIVATFSRGLIPTGSQDPYALRRQALGVVNILAKAEYKLPLDRLIMITCDTLGIVGDVQKELFTKIMDFFTLRIKNMLTESGLRYDLVDSILSMQLVDMPDVAARALAIKEFAKSDKFILTAQAFTRVANLSKSVTEQAPINAAYLSVPAEIELYKVFSEKQELIQGCMDVGRYLEALNMIASLVEPVNLFFDNVMVMDKDDNIRNNRLALLVQIRELVLKVVDFSKVVIA